MDAPTPTLPTDRKPLASTQFRLTTAEIIYRLPDHPSLLQTYLWQEMDIPPQFPALSRFLAFWRRELEGELHSVRVAAAEILKPAQTRCADMMATLQ